MSSVRMLLLPPPSPLSLLANSCRCECCCLNCIRCSPLLPEPAAVATAAAPADGEKPPSSKAVPLLPLLPLVPAGLSARDPLLTSLLLLLLRASFGSVADVEAAVPASARPVFRTPLSPPPTSRPASGTLLPPARGHDLGTVLETSTPFRSSSLSSDAITDEEARLRTFFAEPEPEPEPEPPPPPPEASLIGGGRETELLER